MSLYGALTYGDYKNLINQGVLVGAKNIGDQIQPSSIDLTLSDECYEIQSSFLSSNALIRDKLRIGILFGPERKGLENDEVALADTVVQAPLNPAHSSMNLGHAVMVMSYEWFQSDDDTPDRFLNEGRTGLASKEELFILYIGDPDNKGMRRFEFAGFLMLRPSKNSVDQQGDLRASKVLT